MNAPRRSDDGAAPTRSALSDLLRTHESAPPPATPPRRRAAPREARWSPSAGQPSLFGEILDWMLAPLLLLWPLSIGFTFVIARSLADAPFDRALVDHANVVAQRVLPADGMPLSIDTKALRALLPTGQEATLFFQVMTADGELIAGDGDLPPPGLYDFPAPGVTKLRNDTHHGDEVRVAYTYVESPEDALTGSYPLLVQIAETVGTRDALANEIIKGVIFPQFIILPIAVGLVWFGLSRGLSPLKSMQRAIRGRRPDDLSPIGTRGAPEEVLPLVDAFNDLLKRLNDKISSQKRFIADAAHQMKTPLAGLRTQAELALRETDPAQLRRSLEQIALSSQRTAHLISQLLSLTRMENLRDATPMDELDLAPLCRTVVGDWVPQALEHGIDLGYESDDTPAPIAGQAILLRELLNNLIDNALRYTPRGGTVTVRLASGPEGVVVEVEDNGPGIPEGERALVFERFYRVLGTRVDGSGLGLAIVREIAEQHGARIALLDGGAPDAPHGTRVRIVFPALADGES